MKRDHWLRRIAELDPAVDHHEIYRISTAYEFPWDFNQALSFALFRTYAVPSVGRLLAHTGEFVQRTQKRYDDTVLVLDTIFEHGLDSDLGRTALRRMNRMHRHYDIGNDDLRYVLCTFVVTPIRWLDAFSWRPLTEAERIASATVYAELGARMGIKDIPQTHRGFAELMDDYERSRFGFDPGSKEVADATLRLLLTFHPRLASPVVELFSRCLMDPPLRAALQYPDPPRSAVRLAHLGMRTRARIERRLPPRTQPFFARQLKTIRSYPDGYQVGALGTFPELS